MARFAVFFTLVVVAALANTTPVNDSSRLLGRWDLESTENFEQYMVALGVDEMTRKVGLSITKQTNVISRDGDLWTISMESPVKSTQMNFTLGVEFDEVRLDGKLCKSVVKSEGPNKLVQEQSDASTGTLVSTIVREVNDKDEMVVTLTAGTVTSTRVYKRV